jgi:hypothetical protein
MTRLQSLFDRQAHAVIAEERACCGIAGDCLRSPVRNHKHGTEKTIGFAAMMMPIL